MVMGRVMRKHPRSSRVKRRTANMSKKLGNSLLNIIMSQNITKYNHRISTKM